MEPTNNSFESVWDASRNSQLIAQLAKGQDITSPWYHFFSGAIQSLHSADQASVHFDKALSHARGDPGTTWLLFYEYNRVHQSELARACLVMLERQFIAAGARSAPAIAQQLFAIARQEDLAGNGELAANYYEWSAKFQRFPFWQTLQNGYGSLLSSPSTFIQSLANCGDMVRRSWLLQVSLLRYTHQWLRLAAIFFIGITYLILFVRSVPLALHRCTHLFPRFVPIALKQVMAASIYLSLCAFGVVPFLLATSVVLWPHLSARRRTVLGIATVLVLLAPFDARLQEVSTNLLSPDRNLGLLRRAMNDGWHYGLQRRVAERLEQKDDDYVLHLAAAILDLKGGRYASAAAHLSRAEELAPNDPVVLTTGGNINFARGDTAVARRYYSRCAESHPSCAAAQYNLGQSYLVSLAPTRGNSLVARATELDGDLVNTFISRNASHFLDDWPTLRQFMPPEYLPNYFWKSVLLSHTGSWERVRTGWSSAYFGIPPQLFAFLAPLVLLVLLSLRTRGSDRKDIRKMFFCKFCGTPICRTCRAGVLCTDCLRATAMTGGKATAGQAMTRARKRRRVLQRLSTLLLELFFPGCSGLARTKEVSLRDLRLMPTTSLVYAGYVFIFSLTIPYPFRAVRNLLVMPFTCLVCYNLYFVLTIGRAFYREFRTKGGGLGA